MQRPCNNPKCGQLFTARSSVHAFCSEHCRKAVRGSEYRKAREVALYRDEYKCTQCGSEEHLETHHILPLYQGGGNSAANLQTLCKTCHKEKHRSLKAYERNEGQGEGEGYYHAA